MSEPTDRRTWFAQLAAILAAPFLSRAPAVGDGIPMTTAELARLAATPSWPPSCPPLSAVIARSDPSDLPGEMLLRRLGVEIPSLPPGMYGVKLVRLEDGFTSRAWPFEARVTESSRGTFQADTGDASPLPSLRNADWLPAECRRI